jgi:hypothetical protein
MKRKSVRHDNSYRIWEYLRSRCNKRPVRLPNRMFLIYKALRRKMNCIVLLFIESLDYRLINMFHKFYARTVVPFFSEEVFSFLPVGLTSVICFFALFQHVVSKFLKNCVRFQVLTAANVKFRIVFWDALPCNIIADRRFRGT